MPVLFLVYTTPHYYYETTTVAIARTEYQIAGRRRTQFPYDRDLDTVCDTNARTASG